MRSILAFNKTNRKENKPRNMHVSTPADDFIRIEDAIPALISKSDFAAVQQKRAANKKRSGSYAAKAVYLLSGRIFCGCCGSAMSGHRTMNKEREYAYYDCLKKDRIAADHCPQARLNRDYIDKWVLEVIKKEIFSPIAQKNISKLLVDEYDKYVQAIPSSASSLAGDKAMLERKLNNLYTLVEDGAADEFVIGRINKIKADLNAVKEKISRLNIMTEVPHISEKEIADTFAALNTHVFMKKDTESQKALVNLFIDKVIVENKKISLQLTTERILGLVGAEGPYNTIPQKFTLTFIRPRPLTVRQQLAQKKLNPANI